MKRMLSPVQPPDQRNLDMDKSIFLESMGLFEDEQKSQARTRAYQKGIFYFKCQILKKFLRANRFNLGFFYFFERRVDK